ncbi:Piwi domain-containing protein [Irpex rosettiformis]|uniref:Piwi domain-containing protein n=1 Tax=Irpex rosettiformis TaxID=378272 RepID=A0ACB8UIE5_9APHY|nr:Piwi domain-containing protein [Irpex rosettiformis]
MEVVQKLVRCPVVVQQVSGSPPKVVPPGPRCRAIIEQMQDADPALFSPRAISDGGKLLYWTRRIESQTFNVNMSRNPNSQFGKFMVQVTLVATIQPSDIAKLQTASGAQSTAANAVATNLLQLLISQAPNIQHNFALHSKSFYISGSPRNRDLPSGGLQAWTGFFQSIKPVLNNILINVDTTTAAVYKPGDLLSNAMEVLGCKDYRRFVDLCANNQQAWSKLRKFYKNVIVEAHPSKKGKISELILEGGNYQFMKDSETKTVAEYFELHHHRPIRWPKAFGVRIGKDAVYPAEVCKIISGQIYKKKLDPDDVAKFLESSVMKPPERLAAIERAVRNDLRYNDSHYMQEAGITVNHTALQITARQLEAPNVLYAGSGPMNVSGGAWNVMNKRFQRPAKILAYAVVCFDSRPNSQNHTQNLVDQLVKNLVKLGVLFFRPKPVHMSFGNQGNVRGSLDEAALDGARELRQMADCPVAPNERQVTFVLVILPQNAAVLRKEVKQWSDCIRGIATQCVRQGKYEKSNDQYCNNLALKINAKCGGTNSFMRSSAATTLIKDSMIVGCDVTHPSPGVTARPSVSSLIASIDPEATRYNAFLSVQEPRRELIGDIRGMMQGAFMDYQKFRSALPNTLVVFRDGVSEGEYSQLETTEIQEIESLLSEVRQRFNHVTQLVYIVVGKRHHVRFFPRDGEGDRSGNCHPGLVVDTELAHSTYLDFYLQSHAGILGTSRPSHYVVLKNDPQWTADQLQDLAYSLCYVYAASTRSVSIPAPVYYADVRTYH